MGVVSKALLLTCSQVSTRGDSGFQPRVPGFKAAGPIGGRSALPRAPSRGQAMPARQDGPGPMRRDRAAGDWGSPLQLPRRNMRARWLLKFRREVSPELPPPWAARDGAVAGLAPGPLLQHRPERGDGLPPLFLRKTAGTFSQETKPGQEGRTGWGGDGAQTRMATGRALAKDPRGRPLGPPVPVGRAGDSSRGARPWAPTSPTPRASLTV